MKEVSDYYARLVGWYTQGGFSDELGRRHDSGHHFKLDWWEVLNEPEYEHALSSQAYTRLYDEITTAIRVVDPQIKFVGMSLAEPSKNPEFFEYFLDPKNHRSGVPLDAISYHFYAVPTADQTFDIHPFTFFEQADHFLDAVRYAEAIRIRLSPRTQTMLNEVGTIRAEDIGQGDPSTSNAGASGILEFERCSVRLSLRPSRAIGHRCRWRVATGRIPWPVSKRFYDRLEYGEAQRALLGFKVVTG